MHAVTLLTCMTSTLQCCSVVFKLPIIDTLGLIICYFLVSLFYLMAFAVTMLKLEFSLKGHNPLKQIR